MKEEWKKIKDYPNYSVSNTGLIRDDKRNTIKYQGNTKDGYKRVELYKDGTRHTKRVHRIVANAFIDNPEFKPEVNHKDGCKCNNCIENLEWVTKSENMKHAYATGLTTRSPLAGRKKGTKNPNAGRPRTKVRVVETGEEFNSVVDCAKAINGDNRHIHDCLNGRQKTHRGYTFERI